MKLSKNVNNMKVVKSLTLTKQENDLNFGLFSFLFSNFSLADEHVMSQSLLMMS